MEISMFSKIIAGDIPASFVSKGKGWVPFLDINPRAEGHTLVVPVEQAQRIRAEVKASVAEMVRNREQAPAAKRQRTESQESFGSQASVDSDASVASLDSVA